MRAGMFNEKAVLLCFVRLCFTYNSILIMKQLIIVLVFISMLMVGCKSQEMAAVVEPPPAEEPIPDPVPEAEPAEILVVEERFTFESQEDKVSHDENTYFVIVGSFSYRENAERFMGTLARQNFNPVILISETGFHRVSVDSYDIEAPARRRIQQIRSSYPEYHDTWLLIRKP